MENKIVAGQYLPKLDLTNIHGQQVSVPAEGTWTHLQFRRFAGCPICNVHLQTFIARYDEIVSEGIAEVVVFHSSDAELLPYQGQFPFDVIGDPKKVLYKQFGVEASISAFFSLKAWGASMRGLAIRDKPKMVMMPEGGPTGLPADFLVAPDGSVGAVHYGTHAYDQWSVDDMLKLHGQSMVSYTQPRF